MSLSKLLHGRWPRRLGLIFLGAALTPVLLIAYVITSTKSHTITDLSRIPSEPVAIVFGAGITPNRNLTPMLADRVKTAVNLYRLGAVSHVLMTGDGSRLGHDEVNPMRKYAEASGVAAKDIVMDYAGFSTYESCYRARVIFGVQRAVLVTQNFHLPRALYICRTLGIDAVGVGTSDWGVYSTQTMTLYTAREALAILKALWQVHITRPQPTYLGTYEGWQLQDSQ